MKKGGKAKGRARVVLAAGQARKREERAKRATLQKERRRNRHDTTSDMADVLKLNAQVAVLGCRVKEMLADGNCLFYSLSDQLFGDPWRHAELRAGCVAYMEANSDDFAPFMEDDEPFEEYCRKMQQDGEWGGNQELCATARLHSVSITIHVLEAPRMEVHPEGDRQPRTLHLVYRGQEHYDSLRRTDDSGQGAGGLPLPIAAPSAAPPPRATTQGDGGAAETVRRLRASVPWVSEEEAAQVLRDMHGDFDACIEFLVAAGDGSAGAAEMPHPAVLEAAPQKMEDDSVGAAPWERVLDALPRVSRALAVDTLKRHEKDVDSTIAELLAMGLGDDDSGEGGGDLAPPSQAASEPAPSCSLQLLGAGGTSATQARRIRPNMKERGAARKKKQREQVERRRLKRLGLTGTDTDTSAQDDKQLASTEAEKADVGALCI
jgi:hypothetical protein